MRWCRQIHAGVLTGNLIMLLAGGPSSLAQRPIVPPGGPGAGPPGGPGFRPEFGPGVGPAGGPGPEQPTRELVKQFDTDGDGRLDVQERQAARAALQTERAARPGNGGPPGFGPPGFGLQGFGPPGFGPPGRGRGATDAPKPGIRLQPRDVAPVPGSDLYAPDVLRTLFLDFETDDWEAELADFYRTDVEVPARLTLDGQIYPNVGVRFRGMSSYFTVPAGRKRSLNLAIDSADRKQRVMGVKTLNLLNLHEDESCMSTVLYSHIARQYMPAPRANFVRVVINGENWGIYCNVEQFNKEFIELNYKTTKGIRWKVSGSPMARGGLEYLGDSIDDYRRRYEIKTADKEKSWLTLIHFCKVLNQTPPEQLVESLRPILDIDEVLWFLALDVALINCDGYWIRASDYSIYCDEQGRFHILPHDMNEAFRPPMGPGVGGGPGFGGGPRPGDRGGPPPRGFGPPGGFPPPPGGFPPPVGGFGPAGGTSRGVQLDPLVGSDDPRKPLRSKLLAVPSLRAQYLANVRQIADQSLDWSRLGPVVARYRQLIEAELAIDTRKLGTLEGFRHATADDAAEPGGRNMSLRAFADQRRAYLLQSIPKP